MLSNHLKSLNSGASAGSTSRSGTGCTGPRADAEPSKIAVFDAPQWPSWGSSGVREGLESKK